MYNANLESKATQGSERVFSGSLNASVDAGKKNIYFYIWFVCFNYPHGKKHSQILSQKCRFVFSK
jgi:hypothetical protein